MQISTSVVPPSGWHYINESGVRIDAGSFDELVTNVTNDRIYNGKTLGNPPKDIQGYICEHFPGQCFRASPPVQPDFPVDPQKSMREKIDVWVWNRVAHAGAIELEDQEVANERAKICADCPNNKSWVDSCPCVGEIQRRITLITQNQKTDPAVLGCTLFSHDNTTAAFLPERYLRHRKKHLEEAPSFCWLHRLDEPAK